MTRHAFPLLLALLCAAFAAPAHAQTLSLLCAWPKNSCCDMIYNIDLGSGRVTWHYAGTPSMMFGPANAQITDHRISWTWQYPTNRRGATHNVIDRIRGTSQACGPDATDGTHGCEDPKPCQPVSTVKPKF